MVVWHSGGARPFAAATLASPSARPCGCTAIRNGTRRCASIHKPSGRRPAAPLASGAAPRRPQQQPRAQQQQEHHYHSSTATSGGPVVAAWPSHRLRRDLIPEVTGSNRVPRAFFAPMENLADTPLRMAMAAVGGMDEACTEFIRVPSKAAHVSAVVRGITANYKSAELGPWGVALGAQVMGSEPHLLAAAARRLVLDLGAPRIDLNCGCPANSVTGNGAGSTLLKTPERIESLVSTLVAALDSAAPVSVKMRSGFDDSALFDDNLLAAQSGGAAFVTVHPRTKRQGYTGGADWSLVARAKQLLDIPVIGNGDVVDVPSALQLLAETSCDGIMVGRGAVADPLLFLRIRSAFNGSSSSSSSSSSSWQEDEASVVCAFLQRYATTGPDGSHETAHVFSDQARLGRLKKVLKYLLSGHPALREACGGLLRAQLTDCGPDQLLARACELVREHWHAGGPVQPVLVNHMSMKGTGGGGGAQPYGERQWQPVPQRRLGSGGGGADSSGEEEGCSCGDEGGSDRAGYQAAPAVAAMAETVAR